MILATRNIRLSALKTLTDFFTSGDVFKFNTYFEADLRNPDFVGVRPFIMLLDSRVIFETRHLPLIVIECNSANLTFEMGDSALRTVVNLHVYGRSRGERDDIASSVMQYVQDVTIWDFSGDSPNYLGEAPIDMGWEERHMTIDTNAAIEGSLLNWTTLTASFPVIFF
jgi:hypothetical protein